MLVCFISFSDKFLEIEQVTPPGQSSEAREHAAIIIQTAWRRVSSFDKVMRLAAIHNFPKANAVDLSDYI